MADFTDLMFGLPLRFKTQSPINYVITTPSAAVPITIEQIKTQARIDLTFTDDDTYLQLLIPIVVNRAEQFMRRDIINKTYTAYMNFFPSPSELGVEIRRSKLQSITAIQYLVDGVFQTVDPTTYYFTDNADYASVCLVPNAAWPINADIRRQAVKIIFVSGYGPDASYVPAEIVMGLLQHAAFLYQSRGDAADGGFSSDLPQTCQDIYTMFKIFSIDSPP